MRNWATILLLGTQLYDLIQKAEQAFGGGSGISKRQQVLRDFGAFVEQLAKSGTLSEKLSARVLRIAPSAVNLLVEILNVFEAWDAAQEAEKPPAEEKPVEPPAQSLYLRSLGEDEKWSEADLKDGDEIYSQPWGDGSTRTYIRPAGDRSLLPAGAKLLRTVGK